MSLAHIRLTVRVIAAAILCLLLVRAFFPAAAVQSLTAIAILALVAVLAAVILLFPKCPRCGGRVRPYGDTVCPHCGHPLSDE